MLPLNVFAETALTAEVNRPKLTTDDTLIYKLTISSTEKNIPPPELPKFEGFSVLSQAQSSTLTWASGNLQSKLIYSYILMPKDTGSFKIKPAKIVINGKAYTSQEFEIKVTQGKTKPQVEPERRPSLPEELQDGSGEPRITL